MKHLLSLLLLFGAMVGLFGQEAAYATAPAFTAAAATSMSPDCTTMAHKSAGTKQTPCKGLTFGCIASMGCAVPLMMLPAPTLGVEPICQQTEYSPGSPGSLIGRALEPEPDPPSLLI